MFCSSEQLYQYIKAKYHKNEYIAAKILQCSDPRKVKKISKGIQVCEKWDHEKLYVMFNVLFLKFSQNQKIGSFLKATENNLLVEASPYDTFWGIGMNMHDPRAQDPSQWKGRNQLGSLLMEIRKLI